MCERRKVRGLAHSEKWEASVSLSLFTVPFFKLLIGQHGFILLICRGGKTVQKLDQTQQHSSSWTQHESHWAHCAIQLVILRDPTRQRGAIQTGITFTLKDFALPLDRGSWLPFINQLLKATDNMKGTLSNFCFHCAKHDAIQQYVVFRN